jgi:sarcosine oxidase gamma subunit
MAELASTIFERAPLQGVTRLDMSVLSLRRLRRFGPDLPAVAPLPADLPVGRAARGEGLLLVVPAPGEWLVMGKAGALAAIARAQDSEVFFAVDISEAGATFRLAPGLAAAALAGYSPIDPATLTPGRATLTPGRATLTPGRATRSLFAELTVLLVPEPDGALLIGAEAAAADHLIALLALLVTDP